MASPVPSPTSEPEWRYERKFEARDVPLGELEMRLRLHPAGFRTAFPPRDVNNVYLDLADLRAFRTHVNGTDAREKLRIRWYGAAQGRVAAPVLEVKRKRGMVGTKLYFALAPFTYGPGFAFDDVRRDALVRIGEPDLAEFVNASRPVLVNRYRRHYLASADDRFRLTIDTGVRFERVFGEPPRGPFERYEERGLVLLELKYDAAHDGAAAAIANRLPFRVTRFSKYLAGIARLGGFEL